MKTNYYIEILKDKVKQDFAPNILTVKTTDILSEQIFERIHQSISASTLQRFFDLVVSKSTPSKTSLNILSEFVGHHNWETFCKEQEDPTSNLQEKLIPDAMALKLFEISLKNHDFKTVIDYLKLLPIDNYDDMPVAKIGGIFGDVFRKDKKARQILLPELAKLPQGRFYFYEIFVDIDFLNIYFADALLDYKKHINLKDSDKSTRDLIFTNSLQFLNYLKTNQKRKTIQQGFELTKALHPNDANIETIKHPFPLARYHSSYLIYLFLTRKLTDKELDKTLFLLEEQIILSNNKSDTTFILAELFKALYLSGKYAEIVFLYEKYNAKQQIYNKVSSSYIPLMNFVKLSYSNLNFTDKYNKLLIETPKRVFKDYTIFK